MEKASSPPNNCPILGNGPFPFNNPLLFVIPPAPACRGSSRRAEASRERNDTAKIAIDVRPGGPTAKRQPSPEGLGNRSRRGSERRRRGTQPIVRSPGVIRSEADLSRRAVEGSAVPRTSPGNLFDRAQRHPLIGEPPIRSQVFGTRKESGQSRL